MKVTLVYTGDVVRVHKYGCSDVRKELRHRRVVSSYDSDVTDQRDAARDFWADFIDEGSMTEEDALRYTTFLPCVKELKK